LHDFLHNLEYKHFPGDVGRGVGRDFGQGFVGDVGRGVGGDVGRGVVSIVRQSVGGGVEHGVGGLAAFSILVPWILLKVWHQIREQQKHENSIKTLSEQKNRPKVRNSTKASSLISEKNHTLPQWI